MTPKANQEAKREVLDVCQEMQRVALVIGSSGNASFRVPDTDTIAITPSSVDYACMGTSDVMMINLEGY
jgi:ribulose-5-phosphate 4-epimerase/fuculose-1-phosphate aldolase